MARYRISFLSPPPFARLDTPRMLISYPCYLNCIDTRNLGRKKRRSCRQAADPCICLAFDLLSGLPQKSQNMSGSGTITNTRRPTCRLTLSHFRSRHICSSDCWSCSTTRRPLLPSIPFLGSSHPGLSNPVGTKGSLPRRDMPTTCRPHPPRHHPCVSVPYQSHPLGYPATLGHPPQYQQQHFLLLCCRALFGLSSRPFPAYSF
ncbi:hypothetical protein LZ30DRAFT_733177 [Colletotrichum cereale]|nr:hypothetical protein LZ30DRAFT_733177 [Colletotrichum cereale]